jgi:hypothetical protein
MQRIFLFAAGVAILLSGWVVSRGAGQDARALPSDQLSFFEKKIRPVLVNECYECHSTQAKKPRGKLFLDSRDGVRRAVCRARRWCLAMRKRA